MLSFKSIAVFATLAFGAISSMAAPLTDDTVSSLVARCGCESVPTIITGVTATVTPYINELRKYGHLVPHVTLLMRDSQTI